MESEHYYDGEYEEVTYDRETGIERRWYGGYHKPHRIESEGYRIKGKRDGLWKFWYDTDEHTLQVEGYYINGKP